MKYNSNNKNGFTLVELLVSIGIIVLISTFTFVSMNTVSQKKKFELDVSTLANKINELKVMASSGYKISNRIPFFYGIKFILDDNNRKKSYILYADMDDDNNAVYNENVDFLIQKIDLSGSDEWLTSTYADFAFKIYQDRAQVCNTEATVKCGNELPGPPQVKISNVSDNNMAKSVSTNNVTGFVTID